MKNKFKVGDLIRNESLTGERVVLIVVGVGSNGWLKVRNTWRSFDLCDRATCDYSLVSEAPPFRTQNINEIIECYKKYCAALPLPTFIETDRKGYYTMSNSSTNPQLGQLYQTKEDKPRYGTYLATDTNGDTVLEMKGKTSEFESFKADDIERVIPYTVEISFMGGGGDYQVPKDSVEVGDYVLSECNGYGRVTNIDTKQECADKDDTLVKVNVTPIG